MDLHQGPHPRHDFCSIFISMEPNKAEGTEDQLPTVGAHRHDFYHSLLGGSIPEKGTAAED
jgi:hypothetical protein